MMNSTSKLFGFALAAALLCGVLGASGAAAATQSDMGTGGDAGDTFNDATPISAGTGAGYLYEQYDPYEADLHDYYKIYVYTDQIISASVTPVQDTSTWYVYIDVDLNLYEPGGTLVKTSGLGGSQTDSVTYTAAGGYTSPPGYYVVQVLYAEPAGALDKSGYYELVVSVSGQDDMGMGDDAGDSFDDAMLITASSGTGYIDSMDYEDYYKISLSSGQTIDVDMTPPTGANFDLYLSNPSQIDIFGAQSINSGDAAESVSYTVSTAGYYYIRVEKEDGSGNYSMTVTVTGGGISSGTISASTGGTVQKGDAKIEVPANALAQDTTITMAETTATAPSGYGFVGPVYDIGPSGTSFSVSSTITLPYDAGTIPAGVSEENLKIYRLAGGQWECLGGTVDTSANTVSVQVDNLSTYAVMAPGAQAGGVDSNLMLIIVVAVVITMISVVIVVVAVYLLRSRKTG